MGSIDDRLFFLGTQRPGLLSACEFIVALTSKSSEIDLSRLVIVVPGGRVGRNLRALLVDHAASTSQALSPPEIITPGRIVEVILRSEGRFAGDSARRLAWAEALLATPPDVLAPLVPRLPDRADLPAWLAIGDMLAACHRELAAGMLTFEDVPGACAAGAGFIEEERWLAAAEVQERYRLTLESHGLLDIDLQRIRTLRDAQVDVSHLADRRIVVLGVAELSAVARAALRLAGDRMTCLVFADSDDRERFDEFGCPLTESWDSAPIVIREEQLGFADLPTDQANAALQTIAMLNGEFAADQIAIGIADEDLVPFLQRRGEDVGADLRYAGGISVRRTGPWKLLSAIADYVERHDFDSLRALVRHPDIERRVAMELLPKHHGKACAENWLVLMDEYASASIHGKLTGEWHAEPAETAQSLTKVYGSIENILSPLRLENGEHNAPAFEWAEPMLKVLQHVYAGRVLDSGDDRYTEDRILLAACSHVRDAILDLQKLATGSAAWPPMSAAEALRFVMQHAGDQSIPEEPRAEAIEMLGWLELPLDPSEAVIVVGMNQGRIPAAFGSDPFLTERVREKLGIANARQRYARDAFVLSSILKSRKHVKLIAGRRTHEGDGLWPSRLLAACSEAQLGPRVRRFLGRTPEPIPPVQLLPRVQIRPLEPYRVRPFGEKRSVDSMRVTSFRRYLASPYLFYLENVLSLRECEDPGGEMDPKSFGSLIHSAIERLGRSDAKHSTNPLDIREYLHDQLATLARSNFGDHPHAAVQLQMEIARKRLAVFADWQAERIRDGWLIAHDSEWQPVSGNAVLMVDGLPMKLRGRIDRIEKHDQTGELAILDFKTRDKAETPESVHQHKGGWKDLQLPLYRHLAKELGANDETHLGYVVISSAERSVELLEASWTSDDLKAADETAAQVVRAVREGKFEDVGDGAEPGTVFAALCGKEFLRDEVENAESSNEEGDG
ncbi:MAG TPA: PD-(D/E)XK nuclease family protein [Phycisphaerales bacterium]|nr:PD-(D/E)XK nuclease family protein [Phycisphaerales bacterium]